MQVLPPDSQSKVAPDSVRELGSLDQEDIYIYSLIMFAITFSIQPAYAPAAVIPVIWLLHIT